MIKVLAIMKEKVIPVQSQKLKYPQIKGQLYL